MEKAVSKEKKKLKKAVESIAPEKVELLLPALENLAWMKVKLDSTRETIKTAQVVIAYDNGGGQKGIRKNPLFDGYHQLWKSYMDGIKLLLSELPEEESKHLTDDLPPTTGTILQLVRDKKGA